ncbi:MAG: FecR domain-containing protein [Pseudomonadota bacterium]
MDREKQKLIREALHWRTVIEDPEVSDKQIASFKRWIAISDEHAWAYDYAQGFWRALAATRGAYESAETAARSTSRDKRRWNSHSPVLGHLRARPAYAVAAGLTCLCFAFAIGGAVIFGSPDFGDAESPKLELSTAFGEVKQFALEDGSSLTLGAKSRALVRFEKARRHVELLAGDAYFEVTPLPARPFSVRAGSLRIEVTGTEFDVQLNATDTHLAVSEGRVIASPAGRAQQASHWDARGPWQDKQLGEGEALIATLDGGVSAVTSVDTMTIGAWRNNRLIYAQTPLSEVLDDVERYRELDIRYLEADVASHTVTGSFNAADTSGLLSSLGVLFDLRVTHLDERTVVLAPKPAQ